MKIVVVNLPCAAPSHGPTYRTHHLAEAWVRAGHRVTFVGSSFSHLLTNPPECLGPVWEGDENGVQYRLVRTPAYRGSSLGRVFNILSGLSGLRRWCDQILGSAAPDVVIAASVYQLDNYWACRTAGKHGAAFVRETRDLWPMTLIQLGGKSRWHPFVQWVQSAEDLGYQRANLVSTTLADSFEYMRTRGLARDRWTWLPQCPKPGCPPSVPTSIPPTHRSVLEAARARGDLLVAFTGSLVPASDLGTLVQAASDLRTERVTFVLVGQGPSESELRWRVDDLRLENVAILPPVPKHAVRPLLQLCDAGIQGFTDLPIYRCGVSPNKVFDYLSAGLPVILAASTPSNPVGASGGGIVVSPGSAAGIAEAVRTLCRMSPDARRAMGLRGREHVARHHDLGHVAHRYLDLFVRLRQGGPRNTTEDDLAGTRN